MRVLDACPLCRSTLAELASTCPGCGADLEPYYDLVRLSGQYAGLAREMLSRGDVAGARQIVNRLPQLAAVAQAEQAELAARLALAEGRFADAAALAAHCDPAAAEQILSEAELGLARQRSARESYNYALSAAREGSYELAASYLERAVGADPHEGELWQLKLKVDLKAQRFAACYRDLAALDRLGARPAEFVHLEELLPPVTA